MGMSGAGGSQEDAHAHFHGHQVLQTLAVAFLAAVALGGSPREGRADVERIREKAVELDQKLNKQAFEVAVRGTAPNSTRVYKDFDFILKKTKVDEVAEAESSDPRAKRLRLYLVESIVAAGIATYEDDLLKFEQTSTANVDGKDLTYGELTRKLAMDGDDAVRRKLYSALAPALRDPGCLQGRDPQAAQRELPALGIPELRGVLRGSRGARPGPGRGPGR